MEMDVEAGDHKAMSTHIHALPLSRMWCSCTLAADTVFEGQLPSNVGIHAVVAIAASKFEGCGKACGRAGILVFTGPCSCRQGTWRKTGQRG